MTTKQEMIAEMKKSTDGASFIDRKQLAKHMGFKDAHSVDIYLAPLRKTKNKYFIPEVVEQIMENSR